MSKSVDNSGIDAAKYVHKLQRTWCSANAREELGGVVPVGTVAIKETTNDQGQPGAHDVMVKKAADNPRGEDAVARLVPLGDAPDGFETPA